MRFSRGDFLALLAAAGAIVAPKAAPAAQPPWYPLPPSQPVGKGRALVLSGGGARGAYEAGVVKWLLRNVDRDGSPYDTICGTSAGAINAAFASTASSAGVEKNEQLWRNMPNANVSRFVPPVQKGVEAAALFQESTHHGYPAKFSYLARARDQVQQMGPPKDLAKIMGVIDDSGIHSLIQQYPLALADVRTNLIVTATNVTDIAAVAFYHFVGADAAKKQERFLKRVNLPDRFAREAGVPPLRTYHSRYHPMTDDNFTLSVVASTAVPGAFSPVWIPREDTNTLNLYVDGGVSNNTPINLATAAGATDITVVLVSAIDETTPKPPSNMFELISACYVLMHNKILEDDITMTFGRNILARNMQYSGLNATAKAFLDSLEEREWKPITLRVIRPRVPLELTIMGFNDAKGIEAAFEAGYADAQEPYVYSMG